MDSDTGFYRDSPIIPSQIYYIGWSSCVAFSLSWAKYMFLLSEAMCMLKWYLAKFYKVIQRYMFYKP